MATNFSLLDLGTVLSADSATFKEDNHAVELFAKFRPAAVASSWNALISFRNLRREFLQVFASELCISSSLASPSFTCQTNRAESRSLRLRDPRHGPPGRP